MCGRRADSVGTLTVASDVDAAPENAAAARHRGTIAQADEMAIGARMYHVGQALSFPRKTPGGPKGIPW
jgi:hypothetical protein